MFMGEYNHTIDPKNRVIVPAKFREELGENFVVSAGLDGCLYLTPKAEFDDFAQRISEIPDMLKARNMRRFFLRNASTCEIDKQGRILIPQNLREQAGLEKDVVLIGTGKKIEIWSKEKLDAISCDDSMEDIVEEMSRDYGLRF